MEPCAGADQAVFFHNYSDASSYAEARDMCVRCPILAECREWAILHELHGYWGGSSPHEREDIRRRRGIMVDQMHVRTHART